MKRLKIKEVLTGDQIGKEVLVKGWVRTKRGSKNVNFIALNDGSTINNLQVVVDVDKFGEELLKDINTSASLGITGDLVESQGSGQKVELNAKEIIIYGKADPDKYPIQPKRHTLEFLRENAHLRFRTATFSAVFRIRHAMAFAIHNYFNDKGFVYLHTPIITASDAEGAGQMFRVSTLDAKNPPLTEDGAIDFSQDFFGKPTNLTVSGQLEGELGATALGEIYTFGPTFRAENSNTTRHLAEFWMIEPEMAFYELVDNMDLAEEFLKYLIRYALDNCLDDLKFLSERLVNEEKDKPQDQRSMELIEKLNFVVSNDFVRCTYTEAVDILKNSKTCKAGKFQFPVEWGVDLQSEHERYLVEKHFKKPVILINYPKDIKAFYMKQNDDNKTVAAMDVLFPQIGEIIGGSQREEDLNKLETRMKEMHIPVEEMSWYLDTRRFGTVPHAGFGLGFERFILFVTGMGNIRDVIAFPRTPKNAEF
ncbi:MAG: asparagine--tRNA ligase [Bacteroidetes bacterium GWF2_42_66]|nr:MAG: asparagine--tRNA ligase [Bacteroidetes bacterium GWA2_42_15]OFX97983.1 MAG: asparagine--tRNA ligase [Bacteroidetes bacterium GWE2_42_39]OFY45780.1 MAG: asparagine--tRNA ligase [Bacteroidetes bacterium GWF2_42_66]HBL74723.1 asparagine--tRNA ligase [Prolixibacteraceae bacterium]HCR89398.1 asparagine--tRNA ligase [Prolixibacteraceae bacterium]